MPGQTNEVGPGTFIAVWTGQINGNLELRFKADGVAVTDSKRQHDTGGARQTATLQHKLTLTKTRGKIKVQWQDAGTGGIEVRKRSVYITPFGE